MAAFQAKPHPPLPTKDLLSWLFDDCPYDANKAVYRDALDTSRSISFNQARTRIRKLTAGLRSLGVRPGDCVLHLSFNDINYPMLGLAIIGIGGIFTGANPAYTKLELAHHIRATQAKWLFCEPELLATLLEAARDAGFDRASIKERVLVLNWLPTQTVPAGFRSWERLMDQGEQDWVRFDGLERCRTTTALRATSSGTTGLPKATYEPRHLWPLPMFHLAMLPISFTTAWKFGYPCYIMRRFDLETYVASIDRWQITDLLIVPPIAVAVIMSPLVKGTEASQGKGRYSLRSVKAGTVGAAPLTKETQGRLKKLLSEEPKAVLTQVWGMTESTCIATSFDYPEDDESGSIGRLRPGVEGKIVDDEGRDISGYNVVGELCIRGPTIIPGYFNDARANQESFDRDRFYHTGDIGYVDEKTHKWYIVDRKKELIKVRGFQVAPPELEGVLLLHPNIVDAAVIGVKEEAGLGEGEVPRAFVVQRPGTQLSEEQVKHWVSSQLASYKRLDGGVCFVNSIPKNASGKILKRLLREGLRREQRATGGKL
ncbi:hypothetical protein DV735_g4015, partial [Chaetothyriales sp. CBS 134920]